MTLPVSVTMFSLAKKMEKKWKIRERLFQFPVRQNVRPFETLKPLYLFVVLFELTYMAMTWNDVKTEQHTTLVSIPNTVMETLRP